MAPFPRWADLLPDLLCRIGDRLDLKWYASARGACTAWRCALAPPSPTLLVVAADDNSRWCPYAASLPTRRSFELNAAVVSGSRCVGSSSNGWLALSVVPSSYETVLVLVNPVAAVEILLPPLIYDSRWVSKVVFTPNPTKDDFAAATICENNSVAYVTAGARRWAVVDLDGLTSGDHLVDVVYTDKGNKVYYLTKCGDVYVLRLPERRRRNPANVVDEEAGGTSSEPAEFSVLRPSYYKELLAPSPDQSQEPHLNPPAIVEPLLSEANLPFNPATVFPPSYDIVSSFTSAKNLVLCEGNLYQVWRNQSCTVTLQLPAAAAAGGHQRRRRVAENEILVLRYYPRRQQPCWDVVKDLGGHSFFVGRNNAVSVYAKGKGVPGLRGNCVYWIGGRGKDEGMVFDMESGMSTPCGAPPVGFLHGHPHSTICWYFLSDM